MPQPVRPRGAHPLRTLASLTAGALALVALLVAGSLRGEGRSPGLYLPFVVRADTDSTALDRAALDSIALDSIALALSALDTARADTDSTALDRAALGRADTARTDSVLADTLLADSLRDAATAPADTHFRAQRLIPSRRRDRLTASLFPRRRRPLSTTLGNTWRHELALDSTDLAYIARESVGTMDVRYPVRLDLNAYRRARLGETLRENWGEVLDQHENMRRQRKSTGLGVNITVPGGRQSAFTTIFGKPEVDLRVTGQADIRAGFDYRKSDQQVALTGRASQVDPDFKQDLRLGVTGSIGDKMRVDVNWDTQRDFDYQNQLKLQYTGYEDEIIKSIEAGNVFLPINSSLIRGGQSLFGIKSEFQVGGVRLTTVASQQEGQSSNLSLEGGAETSTFNLRPTDYEQRLHFFLGYYFRNRWEEALSEPPNILLADGFRGITQIEVWKHKKINADDQNVRQVIGLVDLGEPPEIIQEADRFTLPVLPDRLVDQYDEASLEIETELRPGSRTPDDYLKSALMDVPLTAADFQSGTFIRLEPNEYDIDEQLGYITLKQGLDESEALAVAFSYNRDGQNVQVGDFSTDTGGSDNSQNADRLVLKLLRPVSLRQPSPELNPAAWYLEMRNIYSLRAPNLRLADFELDITYQPPGKSSTKLLPFRPDSTLLQLLGLDRLNADGARQADYQFDYLPNFTIEPGAGRLIFPYLEPFGSRLARSIPPGNGGLRDQYVFDTLYVLKPENARRITELDVYSIQGSYKSSVQAFYDLHAFSGLIPGSVRVTSGGTTLSEGSDYTVDYQGGTVTIINQSYLTAGRNIEIDYEQNALLNLQQKTLLGARMDYVLDERLALGSTLMRLSQKSLTDKFRIGEEPISNTIWGVDGTLDLEPYWLTRAVDALPFLQTKAPSAINITGEFAQLLPGHTQTNAFGDTRRGLQQDGFDFNQDEIEGISYIDDFESFETTFSLMRPGAWLLSAAPDSVGAVDPFEADPSTDALIERTYWRGTLGWYQINPNLVRELGFTSNDPAVDFVTPQDVFPNRPRNSQERTLTTFDLYFNPHERGPYNFTDSLRGFLGNPRAAWGGITQALSQGYQDFTTRNIEFVEFVVQPFPSGADDPEARLFVDLGRISEDVIPDGRPNNEDGLSLTDPEPNYNNFGARLPTSTRNEVIDIREEEGTTEDVGLDGLASYPGHGFGEVSEYNSPRIDAFLDRLPEGDPDPRVASEVAKAQYDPSGDDYHYFGDESYFNKAEFFPGPGGASIQQRFSRFFAGVELNSYEAQTQLAREATQPRGNSRTPDSEDLNLNSAIDTENSYFQYALPLHRDSLAALADPSRVDDYVVEAIPNNKGQTWYLVRIPVTKYTRSVGAPSLTDIQSMRMWTTGHSAPITLRLATLDLVGSQWRKSDDVTLERDTPADTVFSETRVSIESVNNEENPTYATPPGAVVSRIRLATGEPIPAREQALVLRVENLMPGAQRGIFQTYNQGINLLKYNHLRMFVHLHGTLADGTPLESLPESEARDKVRLFVRLGGNETNDYYEYEQPLTPSSIETNDQNELWQTNQPAPNGEGFVDLNSMNIALSALNQLKFERNDRAFDPDSVFWSDLNNVPLEPSLAEFAPPGTRIAVKGTPSLDRVTTIVVGLRNPADSTSRSSQDILENAVVWVNELRVSGYDEDNGRAALLNADVQLADLGRLKANFQMQSDGFGDLASTLGERDQTSLRNWAVNTQFNLDKFIPERYGWTIPISMEVKTNTSTPRFDPNRGDVRVGDLLRAIEASETIPSDSLEIERRAIIEGAQTYNHTRSFTSRLQKRGSRGWILRNTLDGISLSYSFTDAQGRSPSQALNNTWRWSTTADYRLSAKPRTFRPFGLLGDLPVLGLLSNLRFNYMPQSLSFGGNVQRRFAETQERPDPVRPLGQALLPTSVEFRKRDQHALTHDRRFDLQYNPFGFLNLSLGTITDQSFNALGVDTLFTSVLLDTLGRELPHRVGTRLDDLLASGEIDSADVGVRAFQIEQLGVVPTGRVINRVFSGTEGRRTERYESRLSATFRPKLDKVGALDWMAFQDVGYSVVFSWRNGPVGNNTGASAGTTAEIRGGLTFQPVELWQKFGFYRRLEETQKKIDTEKESARRREEQERKQRKEQRKKDKELKAKEKELRERAEAMQGAEGAAAPAPPPGGLETPAPETPAPETPAPETGVQPEDAPRRAARAPRGRKTPADTLANGVQPAPGDTAKASKGGFRIPFLKPRALLRRTFLGITGVRDLALTYTGSRRTDATNIGEPVYADGRLTGVEADYSLLNAFKGDGPSIGYRLGLDRSIDLSERVIDQRFQVTDFLTNTDRLQARTSLNPMRTLRINLSWSVERSDRDNITYRQTEGGGIDLTSVEGGDVRGFVWAFGASYLDLFKRQLETYRADLNNDANADPRDLGDENGDGRVVLTNETVVDDFRQAYFSRFGSLDGRGLLPFPLPSWQVNYTGLANWPIIRRLAQSATLRHAYTGDYTSTFKTNQSTEPTSSFPLQAAGRSQTITFATPTLLIDAMRVNERFQPLIGVDLTFKGNVQTTVAWNKGNSYTLSTADQGVGENRTSEVTTTISYQKMGMRIPFLPIKRLNNRITFALTFSRTSNDDRRYLLNKAIRAAAGALLDGQDFDPALALEGDNVSIVTSTKRLMMTPKVSYQFSNRVSTDFFVNIEKFKGDSRLPSTTNVNGGFNVRVSISN